MRFIKYFLVLLVPLLFSNTYSQETDLNLRMLIRNAFDRNKAITRLEYQIESQRSIIRTKYGSLFPTLQLSAGWSRTNQINKGTIQNINGVDITVGVQDRTYNNYNFSMRSDVTLFNGLSNYESIDVAEMTETNYEIQLEKAKTDIVVELLRDYITVLKNQQVLRINEANLEDSKAQLEKIKIFIEVGKRSRSDIYKQDAVVAQNELSVEQSKNALNKSMADLVFDAELPQDKQYAIRTPEFLPDLSLDAIQTYAVRNSNTTALVNVALSNRYDYKSTLKTIDINRSSLDVARGLYMFPTLNGFGSYSLSGEQIGKITNSRVFTVGLTLSYYIFQGFNLDNQRQQAEINLRSSNEDVIYLRNQINLEIKKSVLDLNSLVKQIELADRTIRAAEQDKIFAEESYRVGIGTLLEVNTATTNYNNALITRSNLIYDFILAQKQLEYYQGILKY